MYHFESIESVIINRVKMEEKRKERKGRTEREKRGSKGRKR
jgi:hypothetical protein